MNRFGDQFFSGPALALQQHRRAAGRNLRHQVENLQHRLAFADDVFEVVTLLEGTLQLNVFFFRAVPCDRGAYVRQQLLVVPWLLNKIRRARLHRPHRIFDRAIGGNHDHAKARGPAPKFGQDVEPVAVGESQVQKDEIERVFSDPIQSLLAGRGRLDVIAF